jgi:HSP20 family molecular chaperone IbpA
MSNLVRRERQLLGDLVDWFEGDRPGGTLRAFRGGTTLRIEDYLEADAYVVRAELPGVDPARDVEISAHDGMLHLHAERHEEKKDEHRTEFRYGSFSRTVSLPYGADADAATATYRDGILEVRLPIKAEAKPEVTHITVST